MWTLFLSIKYFFSKRKEGMISLIGGISVLGIALGVASLIIVMSVMNGFDSEVKKKIIGTYAHVIIMKDGGISDYEGLLSKIEDIPEVESASGFLTGQAILRNGGAVTGILLKGIDPDKEAEVTDIIKYSSSSAEDLKGKTVVLGSELMKEDNIKVGDIIELLYPYSAFDMEKSKLKVIGAFTSGRYDYDANIAIVSNDTARELFRSGNIINGVGVRLKDAINPEDVKARLQTMLGYPFIVKSWKDLDRNLVAALALEKKMMFLILALIVTVACFNISSSLIMMVMEKTRDIGILKAIGANPLSIKAVFFFEGVIIGLMGIVLGGFAGTFISGRINQIVDLLERLTGITVFPNDVYYFTEIPVEISTSDITMIILLAFALTISAGIYPAWKASRMNPVDAIRYE